MATTELNWQRASEWHLTAKHGGRVYTISKALVAGVPRYTAWHHDMIAKPRMTLDEAKRDVMKDIK